MIGKVAELARATPEVDRVPPRHRRGLLRDAGARPRRPAPGGADRPLRPLRPDDDSIVQSSPVPGGAARRSRSPAPALPAPFRWEGEHIAAVFPGAACCSRRAAAGSRGPVRVAQHRPPDRRRRRERRCEPGAARRRRRTPARAVPLRPPGPRRHVRRATEPPGPARPAVEEDGQATALEDAAALVFVADCLPVLLAADGAVAALHCGWRGLAAGIVAEGVAALREAGGEGPVAAAIGPVRAPAATRSARRSRRRSPACPAPGPASGTSTCRRWRPTSWSRPASHGPRHQALHDLRREGLFFSHRRDQGVTGRQAGVVWRA